MFRGGQQPNDNSRDEDTISGAERSGGRSAGFARASLTL